MKRRVIILLVAAVFVSFGAKLVTDRVYGSFDNVEICEKVVKGDDSYVEGLEIYYELADETDNVKWEINYDCESKKSVSEFRNVERDEVRNLDYQEYALRSEWMDSILGSPLFENYEIVDKSVCASPDGKKAIYPLTDGRLLVVMNNGDGYDSFVYSTGDYEWDNLIAYGDVRVDFDIKDGKLAMIQYLFNYHYHLFSKPVAKLYVFDESGLVYESNISSNVLPYPGDVLSDIYGYCHYATVGWK